MKNGEKPNVKPLEIETERIPKNITFIGEPECYYSNSFAAHESKYDYQLVFSRADLKMVENNKFEHLVTDQVKIVVAKEFAKHIRDMLGKIIEGDKNSLETKKD